VNKRAVRIAVRFLFISTISVILGCLVYPALFPGSVEADQCSVEDPTDQVQ
jgi:Na+/H+-dicarboxylate symporter